MRGKRWIAGGAVTAVAVTLAVVLVPRTDWWHCRYGDGLVRPDPMEFHHADDLQLSEEFTQVVDAVEEAGLGSLSGGVTTRDVTPMVNGDQVLFATSSQTRWPGYSGILTVRAPGTGEEWAQWLSGTETGVGFGSEHLLTRAIPEDRAPRVTAYDRASGDILSCSSLGEDDSARGPLAAAELPSGGVLVSHPPADDAPGHDLTRLDPATGEEQWSGHSSLADIDRIDAVGDVAVSTRFRQLNVSSDHRVQFFFEDDDQALALEAFDLDTGDVRWTWPEDPEDDSAVAAVLGVVAPEDGGEGIAVVSVKTTPEGAEPEWRVAGLDAATGEELWSTDTEDGVEGGVFDGLLVYNGGSHYNATEALDARTGEQLWSLPPGETNRSVANVRTAARLGDEQLLLLDDTGVPQVLELPTGELQEHEVPDLVMQSVHASEALVVVRVVSFEDEDDQAVLVFERD